MLFNMCAWFTLVFLLPFICYTQGIHQNISTAAIHISKNACNDTVLNEIQECWDKLSTVSVHGIPSSLQKIEETCSVFVSGMECVNYWSRTCLSEEGQKQLESSVIGVVNIYKVLCTDIQFREEYLKHSNCYQRISPHWENCNNKFMSTLKRIDYSRNVHGVCCIRQRYIKCVDDVTRVLCSNVATNFLQSITDSLMKSPLDDYHSSLCKDVDEKNCRSSSSVGCASHTIFLRIFLIQLWNFTLSYTPKCVLAFLNIIKT